MFNLSLVSEVLSYSGRPRVKISMQLILSVDGNSLHRPCLTGVSTLSLNCLRFSLSFSQRKRASNCACYACF